MSDFYWLCSIGTEEQSDAATLTAAFGDGYSQRAGDGLNSVKDKWPVSRNGLTQSEKNAMKALLSDKAGWQSFAWTPPGESVEVTVICKSWRFVPKAGFKWDFSAVFEQVFDL